MSSMPQAQPTSEAQPTPDAVALAVIELARQGRFAEITELFAPPLRPMAPPETLRAAWEAEIAGRGEVSGVGTPVTEQAGPGAVTVKTPLRFADGGPVTLVAVVAEEGHWLAGLQILPAEAAEPTAPWESPAYADPAAFTEHDVTLGEEPFAVPGTVSLPRVDGPVPAVVLLSGSGPHDRDETIGRNKPLKDLAWGLATAGIAVLRFEKVTYAHGAAVAASPDFTLSDEYVPQAAAAIRLLLRHPAVDPARVYLAGHSLGGTVAPRVAAAEPSVAGLIMLAGGAQPLHQAALRQVRYLAGLSAGKDPSGQASRPMIDTLARQAAAVDDPGLSAATPAEDLPFGVPAPYWLDLRGFDPAAAAAALGKPLLILQGGRDYQVTVSDDLSRWRAALGARAGVTFRVYDADNHLFFTGSGPSSPAEYEPAQHMDPAVVADIAAWLAAR
jgi:dienelactone hydrolase